MKTLTEQQAFLAMVKFLENYWVRGKKQSNDIAILLGDLQLLEDGTTVDPAQLKDWQDAVETALQGKLENTFALKKS